MQKYCPALDELCVCNASFVICSAPMLLRVLNRQSCLVQKQAGGMHKAEESPVLKNFDSVDGNTEVRQHRSQARGGGGGGVMRGAWGD